MGSKQHLAALPLFAQIDWKSLVLLGTSGTKFYHQSLGASKAAKVK